MNAPLITAMVSTYASERYLRGCLDDLLAQTLRDQIEIVVIDACSPEREGEIVRAYQQQHGNIRYLRTEVREGTSAAFSRATGMARGRYLTTANTDDRHHPEFCARMAAVLTQCPQFGLVYADAAIGSVDNETWQNTTATQRFAWPHYTPATALSCCLFGAQPMWRRDVHAVAGDWSAQHPIANDHDMFVRLARASGAVHLNEVLGLFLQRPNSNAGSGNHAAVVADACAVLQTHRRSWALDEIVPGATSEGPLAEAAAWFELGNLCALGPYTDAAAALDCYRAAVDRPVQHGDRALVQAAFANNSGCILACAGMADAAKRAFAACAPGPMRDHNVARLAQPASRRAGLRQFRFVEIEHPVVAASRRTRGVTVASNGQVDFGDEHMQVPWDVFVGPNGVPWQRAAEVVGASA